MAFIRVIQLLGAFLVIAYALAARAASDPIDARADFRPPARPAPGPNARARNGNPLWAIPLSALTATRERPLFFRIAPTADRGQSDCRPAAAKARGPCASSAGAAVVHTGGDHRQPEGERRGSSRIQLADDPSVNWSSACSPWRSRPCRRINHAITDRQLPKTLCIWPDKESA